MNRPCHRTPRLHLAGISCRRQLKVNFVTIQTFMAWASLNKHMCVFCCDVALQVLLQGRGSGNTDWFRVIGPGTSCAAGRDIVCTLWVADRDSRHTWSELYIDVFNECLQGCCDCVHRVDGACVG